nr:MAG TPA: hypothetical protein [Caudoviricetes sp.]
MKGIPTAGAIPVESKKPFSFWANTGMSREYKTCLRAGNSGYRTVGRLLASRHSPKVSFR